ncbi:hypothetical protein BGX21_000493 [Mortierella sp. AD011]|nr:hypothetical protein BGX21_000493 [Mortierella sp. AD011]
MENFTVSPLDIPLIVDIIRKNLSKQDIINCSIVNKQFYVLFKRWCWHSIRVKLCTIVNVNAPFSIPLDEEFQKALLDNKNFLRELDIFESDEGELLKFISNTLQPCSLTKLKYVIFRSLEDRRLQSPMDLIEMNTSLQYLNIRLGYEPHAKHFRARFISALSNLPSLTTLKLWDNSVVHRNDYRALLERLPETLETFEIGWRVHRHSGPKELGHFPDSGFRDVYPRLATLSLVTDIDLKYTRTILFPFLRRCPALEILRLEQSGGDKEGFFFFLADPALFPKLTSLNMSIHITPGFSDVISGMKGRIKSFSYSGESALSAEAIANHWGSTLEVLRIGPASYIKSQEIELILTRCTKLRVLIIYQKLYTMELSAYCAWSDNEYNHYSTNWNCLDLEHLELTFLDVRGTYENNPYHRWTSGFNSSKVELYTFNGIQKICHQLGRLTKLRHLRLGWSTTKQVQSDVSLDMSIKNGLTHLKDLRKLEVLDVTLIEHVNFKQEEVEWIAMNWPKLRRIKGLFNKNRPYSNWLSFELGDDIDDEDENPVKRDESCDPIPIQWLRRQRPHLVIS